jgi:toxin-antitoxin system PIN domain toxin
MMPVSERTMPDLLDVNVWLALSVPDHAHHSRALAYWNDQASDTLLFCRVTALALLRHLTNPRVVGDSALDSADAWAAWQAWLAVPAVRLAREPDGLDRFLEAHGIGRSIRAGGWTDAYLAAFAQASKSRLVTFDHGFHQIADLDRLVLVP